MEVEAGGTEDLSPGGAPVGMEVGSHELPPHVPTDHSYCKVTKPPFLD